MVLVKVFQARCKKFHSKILKVSESAISKYAWDRRMASEKLQNPCFMSQGWSLDPY